MLHKIVKTVRLEQREAANPRRILVSLLESGLVSTGLLRRYCPPRKGQNSHDTKWACSGRRHCQGGENSSHAIPSHIFIRSNDSPGTDSAGAGHAADPTLLKIDSVSDGSAVAALRCAAAFWYVWVDLQATDVQHHSVNRHDVQGSVHLWWPAEPLPTDALSIQVRPVCVRALALAFLMLAEGCS